MIGSCVRARGGLALAHAAIARSPSGISGIVIFLSPSAILSTQSVVALGPVLKVAGRYLLVMSSTLPGLASRQVAWQVLQAVAAGAYADRALERELGRIELSAPDRALATELAYGAIRQRRLLDAWLDQLGKVSSERQPPRLRWLLHLGLYQLLSSDRIPASAAVNTTVELAKRGGLSRLSSVVNGILRECSRKVDAEELLPLPSKESAALAINYSLPDWLVESLLQWYEKDRIEEFAHASNTAPSLDLRVNCLKGSRDELIADFKDAGVSSMPIEGVPNGITVLGRYGDIRLLPGFKEGRWCVQDRAAQRIAPLLEPRNGQHILDACAAPGGKSTHIAELMNDQGRLLALDPGKKRLKKVEKNCERLSLNCIQTLHADAVNIAEERPDLIKSFDAILVDVPCSGLGTLARNPDLRWKISPENIIQLVELQGRILAGVAPLLKDSGRIVYSTCSIYPLENDALIDQFLNLHPGWTVSQSWTNWPGDHGDGFFAAVLRKNSYS